MTLLKSLLFGMSNSTINGPIFVKEDGDAERQLEHLKTLLEQSSGDTRVQIETDIKLLNQGIIGENNIAFELKNSRIPMLVLHDLNLRFQNYTAQIDYVIITRSAVIIVECKNLFGNIEINTHGDFIRTLEFNGRYRKEGIYSPITQNERHFELIKEARLALASGSFDRKMKAKGLSVLYRTVVVLANPKTVINMKFAKKEVKEKIIRVDQLINYIKKVNQENSEYYFPDDRMYDVVGFLNQLQYDDRKDYTSKYKLDPKPKSKPEPVIEAVINVPIEETAIYKALKEYRLLKCREKEIKAYYIFNNAQLEELCKKMPKSLDEIQQISGFDKSRINNFGSDILKIIVKYSE